VLSATREIYAVPTLIYHYVESHFYKPPEQFIVVIKKGPSPQSRDYLETFTELGLKWTETFASSREIVTIALNEDLTFLILGGNKESSGYRSKMNGQTGLSLRRKTESARMEGEFTLRSVCD
jgi:hypothetical protein